MRRGIAGLLASSCQHSCMEALLLSQTAPREGVGLVTHQYEAHNPPRRLFEGWKHEKYFFRFNIQIATKQKKNLQILLYWSNDGNNKGKGLPFLKFYKYVIYCIVSTCVELPVTYKRFHVGPMNRRMSCAAATACSNLPSLERLEDGDGRPSLFEPGGGGSAFASSK